MALGSIQSVLDYVPVQLRCSPESSIMSAKLILYQTIIVCILDGIQVDH